MPRIAIKIVAALTLLAAACAAGEDEAEKIPLYLWSGQDPYRTVEAATDEEYEPGDLVVVAGAWRRGGLPGGAVLHATIGEPALGDKNILTRAPVDVRYFYVNALLPDVKDLTPDGFAEVRGLVADDDLYAYAYVVRPQAFEILAEPDVEDNARAALAAVSKDIKKLKLDLITNEAYQPYNKGYKIVADVATAELDVVAVDDAAGLAVTHARFERLPPLDSDVLFRFLDVYVFSDVKTCEAVWAVACVGGFYLE
jgi:hypothetical protein